MGQEWRPGDLAGNGSGRRRVVLVSIVVGGVAVVRSSRIIISFGGKTNIGQEE